MNEWEKWEQDHKPKPQPREPKPKPQPVEKRQITPEEFEKLRKLQRVTMAPGCSDKRFIRQLEGTTVDAQISDRQAFYLNILWYKYRRQLGHNDPRPEGYVTRS